MTGPVNSDTVLGPQQADVVFMNCAASVPAKFQLLTELFSTLGQNPLFASICMETS